MGWWFALLMFAACRNTAPPPQKEVEAAAFTHEQLVRIARKFDPLGSVALPLAAGAPPESVTPIPADTREGPSGIRYRYITRGSTELKHRPWDRVTVRYTVWTQHGTAASSRAFGSEDAVGYYAERIPPEWAAQIGMLEQGDKARFWFSTRAGDQQVPFIGDFELLAVQPLPEPPSLPKDARGSHSAGHGVRYRVSKPGSGGTTGILEMHCTGWSEAGALFFTSVGKQPVTLAASELPDGVAPVMSAAREGSETLFWLPAELGNALRFGLMPGWPFAGRVVLQITVVRHVQH